jgi:hypothetical protein
MTFEEGIAHALKIYDEQQVAPLRRRLLMPSMAYH